MTTPVQRYSKQIRGVLSTFDRLVVHGSLAPAGHPNGMTSFLYSQDIRIFDYPKFAAPITQAIRDHTEMIAEKEGVAIQFMRRSSDRKEDAVKKIPGKRGNHPGLVIILSAMEACPAFKPWHDKQSGKTYLRHDNGKCLHYYFYVIDPVFGLCYIRVPTWLPCRIQIYCNGHSWLANKLNKATLSYTLIDNVFVDVSNMEKAQKLSNSFSIDIFHATLDQFVNTYAPVARERLNGLYNWTIMQAEYSTDSIFKSKEALRPLYEQVTRTAIHAVKPENVATFLGRKLHSNYQDEMGNHFNTRIEGTRIRHSMGPVSIKMYDQFGVVPRIETTVNKVSFFKHMREVEQTDGTRVYKVAQMRKTIYSIPALQELLMDANRRYLEFISCLQDDSAGINKLEKLSKTIVENNHPYKGFNFFNATDYMLLKTLARGEYCISGFQNKNLRRNPCFFSSSQITRCLKRLRLHGLIKKAGKTYKYYLTALGKQVITPGLKIKELVVIPQLALCQHQ